MPDDSDLSPPEPIISGAKNLVRNGLMQNDMNAQGFRILNLDTSNLVIPGIPTQGAVANKWFNSYDSGTKTFGVLQPGFSNLLGNLTNAQQRAITKLGTITEGIWRGSQLLPQYVPNLAFISLPSEEVNLNNKKIGLLRSSK